MPIVTLELVTDTPPDPGRIQALGDELGSLFDSAPGSTWVRVRSLPRDQYAENNSALGADVQPTFVEVLKRGDDPEPSRRQEAYAIAGIVAKIMRRPKANVHVIYAAPGGGRVAFGGQLISATS